MKLISPGVACVCVCVFVCMGSFMHAESAKWHIVCTHYHHVKLQYLEIMVLYRYILS